MLDLLESCSRPSETSGTSEERGKTILTTNTGKGNLPLFLFDIVNCYVRPNTAECATPSMVLIRLTGPLATVKEVSETVAALASNHETAFANTKISSSKKKVLEMKKVLLFGSGMVSKPLMRLLSQHENVHITVATEHAHQAREIMECMIAGIENTENPKNMGAIRNIERCTFQPYRFPKDNHMLPELIRSCDIGVSLLPATMHLPIAEEAVRQGKHFVTASYVSEDMRALHAQAVEKNVILLNEVGLDPGIDHMLIMRAVDSIHSRGGTVTELVSLCGGLPDPVAADNPLRYKISWSPRGVLSATTNNATYLTDGKIVHVDGESLLRSAGPCERFPTMRMEVLPNRDSLMYRELYGVRDVTTICRGTLRYAGWSDVMQSLKILNFLSTKNIDKEKIKNWRELLEEGLKKLETRNEKKFPVGSSLQNRLKAALRDTRCGVKDVDAAVDALEWLGLASDGRDGVSNSNNEDNDNMNLKIISGNAVTKEQATYVSSGNDCSEICTEIIGDCPMDALSVVLTAHKGLAYQKGERDMVAMYHTVVGVMPDGTEERHTSRLLAFGAPKASPDAERQVEGVGKNVEGDSAMSATVGYTTAAAVELILQLNPHKKPVCLRDDPAIKPLPLGGRTGVLIPITAEIYEPILHRLNDFGITWTESVAVSKIKK